jgi:multiple sugar transport system substrate-binding protein
VNWGFNEIVAGFYSGTCAMLDQDPDALIAIAEKMDKSDFAVAPMPLGPSGKSFPTIGYAGWSMFSASQHKDEAWKLIAHLSNAKSNLEWAKFVGVIPTHKGADMDPAFTGESYAGWFTELNDPKYQLTAYPSHLEKLGYLFDVMSVETSQKALLGQMTAQTSRTKVRPVSVRRAEERNGWPRTKAMTICRRHGSTGCDPAEPGAAASRHVSSPISI